jgi:hypothetical protein
MPNGQRYKQSLTFEKRQTGRAGNYTFSFKDVCRALVSILKKMPPIKGFLIECKEILEPLPISSVEKLVLTGISISLNSRWIPYPNLGQ